MSHFTVLVVSETPDGYEEQLSPFNEQPEPGDPGAQRVLRTNDVEDELKADGKDPTDQDLFAAKANEWGFEIEDGDAYGWEAINPKWDWYSLGGRWSGMLMPKHNHRSVARKGKDNSTFGKPEPYPPGRCDQLVKSNLDVEGMQRESVARAVKHWEKLNTIFMTHPTTLLTLEASGYHDHGLSKEARTELFLHPGVSALCEAMGMFGDMREGIATWRAGRDIAIKRATKRYLVAHSFLALDGEWHEQGQMGWFGTSNDTMSSRRVGRSLRRTP